ncbi:MAG: membrane dipeptidase [Clostridia bacterium]|nr:membrane dipeptidase [Clostridia bacterium]
MQLSLFDLHADTAWTMYETKQALTANRLAVSLERAAPFDRYIQVMALWTHPTLDDESGWVRCGEMLERLKQDDALLECRAKLCTACPEKESPTASLLLSVEDARILCGRIERVDTLWKMGVRILTPLWKGESCIGGAYDTDTGLTEFGKQALTRACSIGMIPDLSHASLRSAEQMLEIAAIHRIPAIASHSNAYALCPAARNLREAQIDAILGQHGIIGLNLHTPFLRENGDATAEDVLRQIDYFLGRGAEHALCLGCDMDGATLPPDLSDLSLLPLLAEHMQKRNYGEQTIRAIFFENAYRFANQYIQETN